jgi:hypothetical protein
MLYYDAFLSHAGEQKWMCVDYINQQLTDAGVSAGADFKVFFDDGSLRPGYKGWPAIEKAASECRIGTLPTSACALCW